MQRAVPEPELPLEVQEQRALVFRQPEPERLVLVRVVVLLGILAGLAYGVMKAVR